MKLMKHEKHGFTHAYTPIEEQKLRENGWTDADIKPVVENVIELKKRGRPAKSKG